MYDYILDTVDHSLPLFKVLAVSIAPKDKWNNPPPFNVNGLAQVAAAESLKDKQFILKSIRHNLNYANRLKKFLEKYNIFSNDVSANFLLLNFDECKYSANFLYQKLKNKGIILRSTEDGYHIKNKLRLTIGSSRENLIFMNAVRKIFN